MFTVVFFLIPPIRGNGKSVSSSLAQQAACPSFNVGYTEESRGGRRNPSSRRVYLNVIDGAQCDGTVYGWRYCFDPDGSNPPREIVIAMYNQNPSDNSYQLIPGSRYQVTVEEDVNSFTCRNITLKPSEHFPVQRRAVVAICEEQQWRRKV